LEVHLVCSSLNPKFQRNAINILGTSKEFFRDGTIFLLPRMSCAINPVSQHNFSQNHHKL